MGEYMPRLVSLPNGRTIPLVGVTGNLAAIAWEDDLPLTALAMEAQESEFRL
jgi:hypothetical protein